MSESTMTMPSLGETMEHGIVAAWLIQEGEAFSRGDPIIEFETDKTAVEYPALGDGVLLRQLVKEGDQVMIGAPIAIVDTGDGPNWLAADETASEASADTLSDSPVPRASPGNDAVEDAAADVAQADQSSSRTMLGRATSIRATPAARRLARQRGLSLDNIVGSGRRQRIETEDVEAAAGAAVGARGMRDEFAAGAGQAEISVSLIGEIACQVKGPAQGRPFLLIHGFAGDHSAWTSLSGLLAKSGCRVAAVDLPGHGKTALDAHHVDELSAGLDTVLAHMATHKPCHIVAHSLGAIPAVALAMSQPSGAAPSSIASLTLIAPAGLGLSIDGSFVKAMAAPSSVAVLRHLLRKLSDRPVALSPAAIDELYRSLGKGRLVALAESVVGEQGQKVDMHDALHSLASAMPVRLVMGHADRIINWQDALRVSPTVAVHHLPTAGHVPHWDEPRLMSELILAVTSR